MSFVEMSKEEKITAKTSLKTNGNHFNVTLAADNEMFCLTSSYFYRHELKGAAFIKFIALVERNKKLQF